MASTFLYLSLPLLIHAALIGDYKLYNSAGSGLYDFSSKEMHAEVAKISSSLMVATDRGAYISDTSFKFPSNSFKSYIYTTYMNISLFVMFPANGNSLDLVITSSYGEITVSFTSARANSSINFLKNGSSVSSSKVSIDTISNYYYRNLVLLYN
jgi:hypothetical protein